MQELTRPRRRVTTIQDIARELDLSAMTVSRALNGHPDVREETRHRVLDLAKKKKYKPNRWARSLVTRKSQMIGIVIPAFSHSFFSEITQAVQETIERLGYDLMLCHSDANAQRELREIDTLLGAQVEGLIVASEQESPDVFGELQQQGVPFVLIDRFFLKLDCPRVVTDDRAVGHLATEHLIELGHRHVAHIRGPEVSTGLLRAEGYAAALKNHGLAVSEDIVPTSSFRLQDGFEAMNRLLSLTPRPTAVFASNDPQAIGAIHACRAAGLDVPGDISIVGAGCIEGEHHPSPFLTTIDWSRCELGRAAAEMLLQQISGRTKPRQNEVVVPPHLKIRQSTAPLR